MKYFFTQFWSLFSLGFLSILAQTILFRECFILFSTNELIIGLYFCSWLLWVTIGGYCSKVLLQKFTNYYMQLFLLLPIIPLLTFLLIYLIFENTLHLPSFGHDISNLISILFIINIPISLSTGLLYGWAANRTSIKVPYNNTAIAYSLETIGGIIGALFASLGILLSLPSQVILIAASSCIAIGNIFHNRRQKTGFAVLIFIAISSIGIYQLPSRVFHKLNTDQKIDIYSPPHGKVIVFSSDHKTDFYLGRNPLYSHPSSSYAQEITSLLLAQMPQAKKIAIYGHGDISFIQSFLQYQQIFVDYIQPFPDLLQIYAQHLTTDMKALLANSRLTVITEDHRKYLNTHNHKKYDLILFQGGSLDSAYATRLYTLESFSKIKQQLTDNGIFSLWGGEFVTATQQHTHQLAGTIFSTLCTLWPKTIAIPGQPITFIAGNKTTIIPDQLTANYLQVDPTQKFYNVRHLVSEFANSDSSLLTKRLKKRHYLVNTDSQPIAYLYAILRWLQKDNQTLYNFFNRAAQHRELLPMILGMLFIIVIARVLKSLLIKNSTSTTNALLTSATVNQHDGIQSIMLTNHRNNKNIALMVLGTSIMGVTVVLLYGFHYQFGTLYDNIGFFSAVNLAGIACGSWLKHSLQHKKQVSYYLVILVSLLIVISLTTYPVWADQISIFSYMVVVFIVNTSFGYILTHIACLKQIPLSSNTSLNNIELITYDSFGAAIGAGCVSLLIIPILGVYQSLLFLALLFLLALFLTSYQAFISFLQQYSTRLSTFVRPAASLQYITNVEYVILLISIIGFTWIVIEPSQLTIPLMSKQQVQNFSGSSFVIMHDKPIYYAHTSEPPSADLVFHSSDNDKPPLAYGGPLSVILQTNQKGTILKVEVAHQNETPGYVDVQQPLLEQYKEQHITDTLAVDIVTGATMTSNAIIESVNNISSAAKPLLGSQQSDEISVFSIPWNDLVFFALFIIGIVIYRKKSLQLSHRILYCMAIAISLGYFFAMQLSAEEFFNLQYMNYYFFEARPLFFISLFISIIIFGPFYCGFLCPFGAIQEIIYECGKFLKIPSIPSNKLIKLKKISSLFLLSLVLSILLLQDRNLIMLDPLVLFWLPTWSGLFIVVLGILLLLSSLVPRPFCQFLCPTGKFLQLFHRWKIMNRWLSIKKYNHCDLGVSNRYQSSCLQCNRCLISRRTPSRFQANTKLKTVFLVLLLCIPVLLFMDYSNERAKTNHGSIKIQSNVETYDHKRIQYLIKQGRLSNHKAMYWKTD